ncbi:MAG: DEAD/DEAH box helicase [Candidatus Yanofskybacteria bacterium]|nr:DEAD/DEAH box helicase [Candidatus Yanofskybacteria bacterium]
MYTRSFRSARGGSGRSFGSRPGFRGNRVRSNRKGPRDESIDPSKFINKVVLTEEVEHYKPEHSFQDFNIEQVLKQAIISKKYTQPTPIQDRAIPHILAGKDVVGIANTGTGKTAAFLIPLINKVRLNPREQILIIVPTRELALQIEDELKGFTRGMKIFSVTCVGGMSIGRQMSELRYHNSFVIGTPGRLKDLIERGKINRAKFSTIVLDEADRMLDMGFVHDMRFVMDGMPKPRHTLFFSATLSREIENLIYEFLHEPVRISVKTRDTAANVEQDVIRIGPGDIKLDILNNMLRQPEFSKVLVFSRTKHGAEKLSHVLSGQGFKTESIHGNKTQSTRQRALGLFKDSRIQVLVATDVAARGLDIADVSHVINYDLPATYDDYVHRIGRTGRANKRGKALTFIESR